jgi:type IV secretory pathway protease TraF
VEPDSSRGVERKSVPIGLYRMHTTRKLMVNDLVIARPPEPLATFLADGGYLARGVPLIKRVRAVSGQIVCRRGLVVTADGIEVGPARDQDSRGRLLPDWQGCHLIGVGDVFHMNWDQPASLDGRYFGVLPVSSIIGRAAALWTVERGKGKVS